MLSLLAKHLFAYAMFPIRVERFFAAFGMTKRRSSVSHVHWLYSIYQFLIYFFCAAHQRV